MFWKKWNKSQERVEKKVLYMEDPDLKTVSIKQESFEKDIGNLNDQIEYLEKNIHLLRKEIYSQRDQLEDIRAGWIKFSSPFGQIYENFKKISNIIDPDKGEQ